MQYDLQPSSSKIMMDPTNVLSGEYNAIRFHEYLAQLAPNDEIRNRILEIRKDEMRHYHWFSDMFTFLIGQQPSPQITEPLPTNFKNGFLTAFHDEQNTVDFYHQVARESNIP